MAIESTTELQERPLRIAISGGGTGGHIAPAIAVVEAFRARMPVELLWIGSKGDYEASIAENMNIPFHPVRTGKLRRYASFQTVLDAVRFPIGIAQARSILREARPDVIFATGGFASVPAVAAGRTLGIPSLTHEQTAYIGLATKINARFCQVVALSFERSKQHLSSSKARVIVTGNPVRQAVLNGDAERGFKELGFAATMPLVYVTGGALGSRAINAAVRDVLPELLKHTQVLHQCGPRSAHGDYVQLTDRAASLPEHLRCRYIVRERVGQELGDIYAAASLVVGRAGAGTVNELSALGKPAILIPLPVSRRTTAERPHAGRLGSAVTLHQDRLDASNIDRAGA